MPRHRPVAGVDDPAAHRGFARPRRRENAGMSTLLALVGWCLLLVLCWPLALLALMLWPLVWLLSLPLRLIGITFEAVFALLRAMLMLPARLLGVRPGRR
jgi:hypothetical protein